MKHTQMCRSAIKEDKSPHVHQNSTFPNAAL